MKRFAAVLVAALTVSTVALADDAPPPRHLFAVDAGGLAYTAGTTGGGTIPIFALYEAAVADHVSLFGEPGITLNKGGPLGFGLGVGADFFPFTQALYGFYIGPQVNLVYGTATTSSATANLGFGLAANAGFNIILGSLILGPGINVAVSGLGSSTIHFAFEPKLNVGVGF